MTLEAMLARLQSGARTRFVAFGSSNTERRITGLHWFDWLDLGIKQSYGRVHHCINAGLGGDTTRGLLARFEEDVALYRPHVVFITIGGNDAKPDSGIDAEDFQANLVRLDARVRALGATPVFQTYYAADVKGLGSGHGTRFLALMDRVRDAAAQTGAPLIDHHRRWEPLRARYGALYQALMLDPLHVNALGNAVMGMDLIRIFEACLTPAQRTSDRVRRALWYQAVMDAVAAGL